MQLFAILALALSAEAVKLAGVNIAGCDLGMDGATGTYDPKDSYTGKQSCPSEKLATSQIQHFHQKDGFNIFRLPVPWQLLIGKNINKHKLDENFLKNTYDKILGACFQTGSHCIIDIHNYARYDGKLIGQAGGIPSGALADTWRQLAARYKQHDKVIFGIMNEPFELDMGKWANTVQDSVNAIRKAGAKNQMIFLAGTDHTSLYNFEEQSAPALSKVKNPDGSTDNLIYEVHQYFDQAGGQTADCNDDLAQRFKMFGEYLKQNKRQAFIGEIGGGNNAGCVDLIGAALDVANQYSAQYLGWTSWAAGTFPGPSKYPLSEVPKANGDDQLIVAQCFAPKLRGN